MFDSKHTPGLMQFLQYVQRDIRVPQHHLAVLIIINKHQYKNKEFSIHIMKQVIVLLNGRSL